MDWPRSASIRSTGVFQREPLERHIDASAGGSSPAIKTLPTPTTVDSHSTGRHIDRLLQGDVKDLNLREAVTEMLPTPVVNDMGRGKTVAEWDAWCVEQDRRHGNGNGHGKSLMIEALRLLPTPMAWEMKVFGPNVNWKKRGATRRELPSVLMNLLSDDGNESSGDPPLIR